MSERPDECYCAARPEREEPHEAFCPLAPFTEFSTKKDFVNAVGVGTKADIEAYLWLVKEEGLTPEDALEVTVDQAEGSASCYARIGSCYGGGCKH